jgi:anthranilate synthase component I
LDETGNLSSCIAIRTALIRGSKVEVRVGAGIVLDSDGMKEAQETEQKAAGVIETLELAEGGVL